jgi:hypothetical protein
MKMRCIFTAACMTRAAVFANTGGANHCRFEQIAVAPVRVQGRF